MTVEQVNAAWRKHVRPGRLRDLDRRRLQVKLPAQPGVQGRPQTPGVPLGGRAGPGPSLGADMLADCSQCVGLCCVVPPFDAEQGFGFDKPAEHPASTCVPTTAAASMTT